MSEQTQTQQQYPAPLATAEQPTQGYPAPLTTTHVPAAASPPPSALPEQSPQLQAPLADLRAEQPSPAQREADAVETIEVTWQGRHGEHTFTIPAASDDWPMGVTLAYESGQGAKAVLGLIGPAAWARLEAKGYRTRDLSDLSATFLRQYGLGDSGE